MRPGPGELGVRALGELAGDDAPGILVAHLAADGVLERADDQDRLAKAREYLERLALQAGVVGLLADGEDAVVEGLVAVLCGELDADVDDVGLGDGLAREEILGDLARVLEDVRVVGLAERAEELRAPLLQVGRAAGEAVAVASERGVDGAELPADERVELRLVGIVGDAGADVADGAEHVAEHERVGVFLERQGEVEELADGNPARLRQRPAVADEADALGNAERGFCDGGDGLRLRGRVGDAVVALLACIGVEEPRAGRGLDHRGRAGDERADGRFRPLFAYRNGPAAADAFGLRGVSVGLAG